MEEEEDEIAEAELCAVTTDVEISSEKKIEFVFDADSGDSGAGPTP